MFYASSAATFSSSMSFCAIFFVIFAVDFFLGIFSTTKLISSKFNLSICFVFLSQSSSCSCSDSESWFLSSAVSPAGYRSFCSYLSETSALRLLWELTKLASDYSWLGRWLKEMLPDTFSCQLLKSFSLANLSSRDESITGDEPSEWSLSTCD